MCGGDGFVRFAGDWECPAPALAEFFFALISRAR
jgi:hypothetical protein